MKRFVGIVVVTVLTGVATARAAVSSMRADDFADGSRDTTLWSILQEASGVLVESTGQLHFIGDGSDVYQSARWSLNFGYSVQKSAQIESVVRVRLPPLVPDTATEDVEIASGLGWKSPDGTRTLFFQIVDTRDGRSFRYLKVSPGGGFYASAPLPDASAILDLRMLYRSATGTVSFYWKRPGETVWNRVFPAVNLNAIWELSENYKVVPLLAASTYAFPAYWSHNLTLDKFRTTTYTN